MNFDPPLIPARLIRRYKRFLADVTLDDGREVTAHCANPGAMLGVNPPGARIWLEPNDDPKRKLKYSWKLLETDAGGFIGIDTSLPNRIVGEALAAKQVEPLSDYENMRAEVKYSKNSRIDFLLSGLHKADCYVEVKNVHLMRENGHAEFPDCVTKRGAKHLQDLTDMVASGHRAIMLYLVQRDDCHIFSLADDLDPEYAAAYRMARSAGVETLCYSTNISTKGIVLGDAVPVDIP